MVTIAAARIYIVTLQQQLVWPPLCYWICYNMSYFFNNLFLQTFADEFNVPFLETSAKYNENVEEAFLTMVTQIMKSQQAEQPKEEKPIRITPLKPQERKKKKCC